VLSPNCTFVLGLYTKGSSTEKTGDAEIKEGMADVSLVAEPVPEVNIGVRQVRPGDALIAIEAPSKIPAIWLLCCAAALAARIVNIASDTIPSLFRAIFPPCQRSVSKISLRLARGVQEVHAMGLLVLVHFRVVSIRIPRACGPKPTLGPAWLPWLGVRIERPYELPDAYCAH